MDKEITHFFIRAVSHIQSRSESLHTILGILDRERRQAEAELKEVDALSAQILMVAQTLDGRSADQLDACKLKAAMGSESSVASQAFEDALDLANVIRVQNEKVGGVLVVKSADLSPEALAAFKNFYDSQVDGKYRRIEIVHTDDSYREEDPA